MVLWTTDHLLEFTSSPATGLLHLGLGFDPLGGLLDVFGPQESGVNVIDAHEGALGGSPAHFDLPGRDRTPLLGLPIDHAGWAHHRNHLHRCR
jgi:hypothetical protein